MDVINPEIEKLIREIYDCVADPSGWEKVLQQIVTQTHAATALMEGQMSCPQPRKIAAWNADPSYRDIYYKFFHARNPFVPIRKALGAETVFNGNVITGTESYRASAFYNEFARPQAWNAFISVSLSGPGNSDVLALICNQDTDFTQTGAAQLLGVLAPHLRRAYDLGGLLSKAQQTTAILGEAVAAAGFGTILLSEKCRIIYANPVAEVMLREQKGLAFIRGELVAEATPLTSQLAAMVKACVDPHASVHSLRTVIKLARRDEGPPILAYVLPVQGQAAMMLTDHDRPVATLFLVDPQRDLSVRLQNFANLYALNPTEIAVLSEILGSQALTIVAAKLGMSPATLRMHLGRIMAKTGTSNRLELLRRFFETISCAAP